MALSLSSEQRLELEQFVKSTKNARTLRDRAQLILLLDEGRRVTDIVLDLNVSKGKVNYWAKRWQVLGMKILEDTGRRHTQNDPQTYPSEDDIEAMSIIEETQIFKDIPKYGATIRIWESDGEFWVNYRVILPNSDNIISNRDRIKLSSYHVSNFRDQQDEAIYSLNNDIHVYSSNTYDLLESDVDNNIVRIGKNLFSQIFWFGKNNPLLPLGRALVALAEANVEQPPFIEIHTSSFFIAWQYLYVVDPNVYPKIQKKWLSSSRSQQVGAYKDFIGRFWGFKFITSIRAYDLPSEVPNPPKGIAQSKQWNEPIMGIRTPMRLAAIYNTARAQIRKGVELEISYLRTRSPALLHFIDIFDEIDLPTNPLDKESAAVEIMRFMENKKPRFDVLYLACHSGVHPKQGTAGGQPSIGFGREREYLLSTSDMAIGEGFKQAPQLIIANACSTSRRPLDFAFNLVHFFGEMGAYRLIVTECNVNSVFASRFMISVMDRWLGQEIGIGKAIWNERQKLLTSDDPRNQIDALMSLVYVLYTPPQLSHDKVRHANLAGRRN